MSMVVALEPQGLRRILKAGLRQGIADDDLRQLIREAFTQGQDDRYETTVLQALEVRGWLILRDGRWKTKLG